MNTEILEKRIAQLKRRRNGQPAVVDTLHRWLLDSTERQRLRINPYVVAEQTGIDMGLVVTELLHGVPLGLFDLNWDIHCPHCNGVAAEHVTLMDASNAAQCPLCDVAFRTQFDRLVEVTFKLNSEIEVIELPPLAPPPRTVDMRYRMELPYGMTNATEDVLEANVYQYACPISRSKGRLVVEGEPTDITQVFHIDFVDGGGAVCFEPDIITARPGPIRLEVANNLSPLALFAVAPRELPMWAEGDLPPRLSGLDVIHYRAYWELFNEQVLSNRERMSITSVTTVFTDITGSTQMYERLGDATAYNIVRDHFDILFNAVEACGGTVIKTIGDAVMASFTGSDRAVLSILDALAAFREYNASRQDHERVNIKIGIHRGPAILVNLNNHLDYFGSTINRAARIQSQARSNEIVFSDTVYDDEYFRETLAEAGITNVKPQRVTFKGVVGKQTIYRISMEKPPIRLFN